MVRACPRSFYLDDLGHALVALLLLVGGVGDGPRDRVVLLAGDDEQWPAVGLCRRPSLGPGVQVAVAAWNSGAPGPGRRRRRRAAWPRPRSRRWRSRSGTARRSAARRGCGWRGRRGPPRRDLSAEIGSGRTPRNGAGSMATEATERPRPATIWVSSPPKELTDDGRLLGQRADHVGEVVGDLADGLASEDLGVGVGFGRCPDRRLSRGERAV